MNRNYEFVMSLGDKFSGPMAKIAQLYDSKVNQMAKKVDAVSRGTGKMGSAFGRVGQHVDVLHKKISGLGVTQKIKLDSSELDRANAKAGQFLDKMGRLRNSNGRFGGGTGNGSAVASAIGGSGAMGGLGRIGGLMVGGIGGYLGMEGLRRIGSSTLGAAIGGAETNFRLSELMGGAAPVARLTRQIDAYAPERRDQLLSASAKLSGSGVGESALMPTLRMLNNISALTGQSVEEMATIQSQIKATGYVQGDEINRYKERGINLSPFIANQMGVNENQIAKLQAKGLITYDILDKAMQKYAGAGGKFDGAYERRRDSTPMGRMEHLGGKVGTRLREFGSDNLLPILNKGLDFIDKIFEKIGPLEKSFGVLKEGVKTFGGAIVDILQKMGWFNSNASLAENLVNTMAFAVNASGRVFQTVGGVISWFADSPLAQLTAGLFTIWRLLPILDKAWIALNKSFLFTPLGAAVGAFVAIGAALYGAYEKFEWFRNIILDGWEGLKVFFSGIGGILKYFVLGNWDVAASLSRALDNEAEKRGKMAIVNDRNERSGLSDRRRQRRINEKLGEEMKGLESYGPKFKDFDNPDKKFGGLNDGLSSAVGNSKSSIVNITVKSLIEKSEITINDFQGNYGDLESKLIDALMRVVNSGARVVAG